MSDEEFEDIDRRLDELEERIRDASLRCHNRSEIRIAREGRRLAKQEHRLIPYLSFSFHLINSSDDVLDVKQGCEVAVEMIALLEDEDRARQFQADLPMDEYEHTKWWLTSFAYKKLATLTGHAQGYNSDGMHQCISDGMNVCRRTGNLREILHFREFACEVYRAADDLDMALHFARGSLELQESDDSNRKVASADDAASVLCLQGKLEAAVEMTQRGWQYCLQFHNPYLAQLNFLPLAREVAALAGRSDLLAMLPRIVTADEVVDLPEEYLLRIPPEDECPYFKFLLDQSLAVEAACRGDAADAIRLLQPWDRQLYQSQCLTRWFGVRCRLIAVCRMAGQMDQARKLADACEVVAAGARDWVTLRRLKVLLDESATVTPMALVSEPDCGPFSRPSNAISPAEPALQVSEQSATPIAPGSPWEAIIAGFYERLQASDSQPNIAETVSAEILAIEPPLIANPDDAGKLLHLIRFLTKPAQARSVLVWAGQMLERFLEDATVISMYAALGAHLRAPAGSDLDDLVTEERIESLFRQSLDLNANSPGNFARAGMYQLRRENYGEAERCLARSFRLDRRAAIVAISLAEVYSMTDRQRDALEVLDMAIREGADNPQLAWEAAIRANNLAQFVAVLAYLDLFEKSSPDTPWANHYRAYALLELNRPDEALVALDREAANNPDAPYPVQLQRVSALGQLRRADEYRHQLVELLATPMTGVTYLSSVGLQRLFRRLWASSRWLDRNDPLSVALQNHLVATGLAANDFFDDLRTSAEGESSTQDIRFYRIFVRQLLDAKWRTSPGCLAGEENWNSYDIAWGVLATDETAARELVLNWQRRCYPGPAEVIEVDCRDETYQDFPGVVWQGQREGRTTQD